MSNNQDKTVENYLRRARAVIEQSGTVMSVEPTMLALVASIIQREDERTDRKLRQQK